MSILCKGSIMGLISEFTWQITCQLSKELCRLKYPVVICTIAQSSLEIKVKVKGIYTRNFTKYSKMCQVHHPWSLDFLECSVAGLGSSLIGAMAENEWWYLSRQSSNNNVGLNHKWCFMISPWSLYTSLGVLHKRPQPPYLHNIKKPNNNASGSFKTRSFSALRHLPPVGIKLSSSQCTLLSPLRCEPAKNRQ